MEGISESVIDVGVAGLTLPGQSTSGDRHVFEPFSGGLLVAAVDGIGHGNEAAMAAEKACAILRAYAAEPVIVLAERCHGGLRSTRGVVMSLAAFDVTHNLMTWLGIGNVQGVVRRFGLPINGTEESLLLRAGVVGSQLPPLRASVLPVARGDTLILATDGVQSGFSCKIASATTPQRAAEAILDGFSKGTDDALVLVARYEGCRTDGNRDNNE
jgi:negative regulator of sigma-B (phosphoserine phosphatase)